MQLNSEHAAISIHVCSSSNHIQSQYTMGMRTHKPGRHFPTKEIAMQYIYTCLQKGKHQNDKINKVNCIHRMM